MTTQDNSLDIWNAIIKQNFSKIDINCNINSQFVETLSSKIVNECRYVSEQELRLINNIDRLKKVSNYLKHPEIMFKFFNNIIKNNEITIPSPFNNSSLKSKTTFLVEKVIFIPFYDNKELFFIIQNTYYISAFYFPKSNIIYFPYRTSLAKGILKEFISKCILNYKALLPESLQKNKKFLGIITSSNRPYHYFYDRISALEVLEENNLLKKINFFYSFKNENYLKLENIYSSINHVEVINSNNFYNHDTFILKVGLDYKMLTSKQLENINHRVNTHVFTSINDGFYNLIMKNRDRFPIVWIGVTGQKRLWIEQEVGYASIINKLYEKFPNLLVLFDGWTTSEQTLNDDIPIQDLNNIDKDNIVVQNIISKINSKISFVSLIGKTPSEKLSFAQFITFYITNNATGSIYVSRFAKKPGVTHNSIRNRKPSNGQHIHGTQRIEVSEKYITDCKTDSIHKHFGDYSIEWQVIWEYTKSLMIEIGIEKVTTLKN